MVVCRCERVSERRVKKAIKGGCTSLTEISQATGAGRTCGACHCALEALLADQQSKQAQPST